MRGLLNLLLFGSSVMEMNNGLVILENCAARAYGVVFRYAAWCRVFECYLESRVLPALIPILRHPIDNYQFSIVSARTATIISTPKW